MRIVRAAPAVALSLACAPLWAATDELDLAELSIEELSNLEVTSVSRRPESLADAPASIYVITGEQIRRSGAITIPEALRLAPNLQVARIDAREYAISARGFQSYIANKLLVLIDGRTVYSELFSGVFWDAQDLLLADIERIEVISGPGATTWGVNAVNGVINIITRPARETQGTLSMVGAGNVDLAAGIRHGGTMGETGYFRVYGKGLRMDDTELAGGSSVLDRWQRGQLGFRADWGTESDSFTFQGDIYRGYSEQRLFGGPMDLAGGNLLARWTHSGEGGASRELQAYYERTERDDFLLLQEEADIFDIAWKQAFAAGTHELTWGAGYRYADSVSEQGMFFRFIPAQQSLSWYNVYGQDEIALSENLALTLGTRFEHNEYTDWEVLPNVRLAWKITDERLLWSALSRAVRSPARLDREIFTPTMAPFLVGGGPNFDSETANVLEVGLRAQPDVALSYSLTAFYHDYDRLRSGELGPPGGDTFVFIDNGIEGEIYGLEGWGNWQVTDRWRLSAGGTAMETDLRLEPGSTDPIGPSNLGNDPDYHLVLRSSHDLTSRHRLDLMLRRVDDLPLPEVPSYTAVDVNFGWQVDPGLVLSLRVRNLLDSSHGEFGGAMFRSEFERAAFLKLEWRP